MVCVSGFQDWSLLTIRNTKKKKKRQSCPTASSPYRYRRYESPYLTSLNNGNAMAGDGICSAMPLGFFSLLAPDWGKKHHQGCYWGNWQKWNMMAKYCIDFFFLKHRLTKRGKEVIFTILITTPHPLSWLHTPLSQPTSSHSHKISRRKAFLLSPRQKQRHTKVKQAACGCLDQRWQVSLEVTPWTHAGDRLSAHLGTPRGRKAGGARAHRIPVLSLKLRTETVQS